MGKGGGRITFSVSSGIFQGTVEIDVQALEAKAQVQTFLSLREELVTHWLYFLVKNDSLFVYIHWKTYGV